MANFLAQEKSVYLQQHANNPVHWYAWGDKAFKKAKSENKPLLISIGYSTCHWCHVMEHESFEDAEVAKFLNENFVAIKVDREEHPDVDEFYMDAVQALTRRGGWPLNVFVTPDLAPFFGGTYFPKPVFLNLLTQIQKIWNEDPQQLFAQAKELLGHITSGNVFDSKAAASSLEELSSKKRAWDSQLVDMSLREFDPIWGGFGSAPKFPRSHAISALLRAALGMEGPSRKAAALRAVSHTLKGMAYGGMHDHLRGGFHRYSTDERWLVPHFEKMLYDQALLIQAYSEGYRVFREDFYADIVEGIVDYLEAEMRLPEGGFAAAQDADSEGVEGKFYVWSRAEIEGVLPDEPAELREKFRQLHSVTSGGNWEGANVLSMSLDAPWELWAAPDMKRMRKKLLDARAKRMPPIRDPKVIVAWNAWMATGLLQASINLIDRPALSEKLLVSAEKTLNYLKQVAGEDLELPRIIYGAEKKGLGYFEDYGAVIEALQYLAIRKCEPNQAAKYLAKSEQLFRSPDGGLKSRRASHNAELPGAKLEHHDGATPAPLSVYVGAQLRQALLDSQPEWLDRALKDLAPLERILSQYPVALTHLLSELAVVDGFVIKAPAARRAELWREWAARSVLAGAVLTAPAAGEKFEACDFRQCFANGNDLKAVWKT